MFQNLYKQQYIDISEYTEILTLFILIICGGFAPTPPVLFVAKRTKKTAFL